MLDWKKLHNVKKAWRAANFKQYRKQSFPTFWIESFSKVNEIDIQRHVLFSAFLLHLSNRENHISGGALKPKSTLRLGIYYFGQLLLARKDHTCKLFVSNTKQGNSSVVVAIQYDTFIFTQFDNLSILMSCGTWPSLQHLTKMSCRRGSKPDLHWRTKSSSMPSLNLPIF